MPNARFVGYTKTGRPIYMVSQRPAPRRQTGFIQPGSDLDLLIQTGKSAGQGLRTAGRGAVLAGKGVASAYGFLKSKKMAYNRSRTPDKYQEYLYAQAGMPKKKRFGLF